MSNDVSEHRHCDTEQCSCNESSPEKMSQDSGEEDKLSTPLQGAVKTEEQLRETLQEEPTEETEEIE